MSIADLVERHPEKHTRFLLRGLRRARCRNPKKGIEVGVSRGRNAYNMLESFPNLHLIGIDPWEAFEPEHVSRKFAADFFEARPRVRQHRVFRHIFKTQEYHEQNYEIAKATLEPFSDRIDLWRTTSQQASTQIGDETQDLVFIDGDHTQANIDVPLWFAKVKRGGILCGHDYGNWHDWAGHWNVKPSVDKLCEDTGLSVRLFRCHVWFVVKSTTHEWLEEDDASTITRTRRRRD